MKWWESQPVQSGLKSFAAGVAVCGLLWTTGKINTFLGGDSQGGIKILRSSLDDDHAELLDHIAEVDNESAQLLSRLEPFRRFQKAAFDEIIKTMSKAIDVRLVAYKSVITATSTFEVRKAYQRVIEAIRIFRSLLESHLGTEMEDFDEVAVDFNSKVEQVCNDIIQDQLIS
jgi:hypothetical protein